MVADPVNMAGYRALPRPRPNPIPLLRVGVALLAIAVSTACSSLGTGAAGLPANASDSTTTTSATTSASTASESATLPPMTRFRIGGADYGPVQDCEITGETVTCTASWEDPYQVDTYTGGFTGTLVGLAMTGTSITTQTGKAAARPGCLWTMETTTPVTYTFSPQGTVTAQYGPGQWRKTNSGSCSGSETGTDADGGESGPITWKPIG